MGADRRLVSSPTFVLIQEYEAALPIFHCDTYRLRNVDEFIDLGIDEILHAQGVCLIEWADRVAEILPPDHLRIEIEIMGPTARSFRIQAGGPKSGAVLATARAAVEGRLQPSQRAGGFIPPGFLDDAIESEGGPPG
jgi:tRNA threonylcarbamoyladenosine biosynthesis protein TsaE